MIPGVESFLEQYHMIEQSDVVVAGVSGGADSVCLLLHLLELKEKLSFTLAAVHVQHGIRGEESLQDAAFVEELAGGIRCSYSAMIMMCRNMQSSMDIRKKRREEIYDTKVFIKR